MTRFRLRTLLIVLALGPMVLAWAWIRYDCWNRNREVKRELEAEFAQVLYWAGTPSSIQLRGGPFSWDLQPVPASNESAE